MIAKYKLNAESEWNQNIRRQHTDYSSNHSECRIHLTCWYWSGDTLHPVIFHPFSSFIIYLVVWTVSCCVCVCVSAYTQYEFDYITTHTLKPALHNVWPSRRRISRFDALHFYRYFIQNTSLSIWTMDECQIN